MEYEIHPLANLFPMMKTEQFENLKAGLQKNGQLHPVILFEGKILDGRNRYLAMKELGLLDKLWSIDFSAQCSPEDWVIETNLNRRDLTAAQKSCLCSESMEW